MQHKKIYILSIILVWPLMGMECKEPEHAAITPIKSYNIFIIEHSSTGPNNLHQLEQLETLTIAELKINVAQLINIPPSLFQLVLDHKKGIDDTLEHESNRTLQSHFALTQSAWLFTIPPYGSLSTASSSSSVHPIQLPTSVQDETQDQLEDLEDIVLTPLLQELYFK